MTDGSSPENASWVKVALAILPGLLYVEIRGGLLTRAFGLSVPDWSSNGLLVLCAALVLAGLVVERRLALWCMPAAGLLLPNVLFGGLAALSPAAGRSEAWMGWLAFGFSAALLWFAILLFAFAFRVRDHMSRFRWTLFGLLVTAALLPPILDMASALRTPGSELISLLLAPGMAAFFVGMYLFPTAVALPLARRYGVLAALLVVSAVYVTMNALFDPDYALAMWMSRETAALVGIIPPFCFLVISPLLALRARSIREQSWAIVLPPALGLLTIEVVAGAVRPYYGLADWLRRGAGVAELVVIFVLAVLVYRSIAGHTLMSRPRTEGGSIPVPL